MGSASEVRTIKSIWEEVEKWRVLNHIKKLELATALGMTDQTLRRLYNGERDYFTSKEIKTLSHLMGKPKDFFFPDDEEENFYEENLKRRCETPEEKAKRRIKEKCAENDEADRRLSAAVKIIKNVKNRDSKKTLVKQIEGLAVLAENLK